ncbi:Receptor-type tyrosine-protein phosphatase U, partial [Dissostichus eleginoides]
MLEKYNSLLERWETACLVLSTAAGCTFEEDSDPSLCDFTQGEEDDFDWLLFRTYSSPYASPDLLRGSGDMAEKTFRRAWPSEEHFQVVTANDCWGFSTRSCLTAFAQILISDDGSEDDGTRCKLLPHKRNGGEAAPFVFGCFLFEVAGTVCDAQLDAPYSSAKHSHKQLR